MTIAPRRRAAEWLRVLPVLFAIVAEAAWVWVVAGLIQEYALAPVGVGLPATVTAVGIGAAAGNLLGPRLGMRWPLAAALLALTAGAVGWLAAPEVRDALVDGSIGRALGLNPGGWLAALAVLRGYRHARLPLHEPTLVTIFAVGVPALAFAAVAGGMVAEPFRSRFLSDALLGATIFAASSTVALALARLSAVGADAGFDWRRNPPWLLVVIGLITVVAAVAQPASQLAGPVITLLIGLLAGPLVVVGLVLGFTRRAAWFMFIAAGATLVYVAIVALFLGEPASGPVEGESGLPATVPERAADDPIAVAAFILLAATVAIVVLVRLWMRRSPPDDGRADETRTIDRGETRPAGNRRRRWRLRAETPRDAVAAYRALDDELGRNPALGRSPGETPREHAHRLRAGGQADFGLDLLAADYALARFGETSLSPAENRRAVERWRRLRRLGRGHPQGRAQAE